MKLYKVKEGLLIEKNGAYLLRAGEEWDAYVNDDDLLLKMRSHFEAGDGKKLNSPDELKLLAPLGKQELWACGVTYLRSKEGRQEESKESGSGDFYARVYDAERPEVFFKATPHRVAGPGSRVRIRKDSSWNVPEPELTLFVTSSGKIVGYTIGNDMSSRSIEGENPLYLPQAKTYDGCAAIGPCLYITSGELAPDTRIGMKIFRQGSTVLDEAVSISQMKRKPAELVSYLYRECSFPDGCLVMTGTGIVPGNDFTLQPGDEIHIQIDPIGRLINWVG